MRRLKKLLSSRLLMFVLLFVTEIMLVILGVTLLRIYWVPIYIGLYLFEIIVIIYVLNSEVEKAYQISWLVTAAVFPLAMGVMYLLFGTHRISPKFRRGHLMSVGRFRSLLNKEDDLKRIEKLDSDVYKQAKYINNYSYFPITTGNRTEYFPTGELMYQRIIEELKKATSYIYIEMFIMQEGEVLNTVVDILEQKVKEGVDVRVIYDDLGCAMYLPRDYYKRLQKKGIKCEVFNPIRPVLLLTMNNRDHRKLVVIDGKVGFTGGINFSDEYINAVELYGHWKDAGIMIKGPAVINMVVMFLQFWEAESTSNVNVPVLEEEEETTRVQRGFLQPFSSSPTDDEDVAKNTYLNMIWEAKKYVYIMTPYLVADSETLSALKQAAKNDIDVRIIVPHIPDKWYVLESTRASYKQLLSCGVKIYEYTPGFIHSKIILSDDKVAIVGTINLDYRSYFLDFECGVFIYQTPVIKDIRKDFDTTFPECKKIEMDECLRTPWYRRVVRAVLKVFEPLM